MKEYFTQSAAFEKIETIDRELWRDAIRCGPCSATEGNGRGPPGTMMITNRGLRHLALRVADVARATEFYARVFGMKPWYGSPIPITPI